MLYILVLLGAATASTQQPDPSKAYATIMQAQADMITAQATVLKLREEALKTRVTTMGEYQKVVKMALENEMIYAKNFYDKKQLRRVYGDIEKLKSVQASQAPRIIEKQQQEQPKQIVNASYKRSTNETDVIKWPSIFLRKEFDVPRKKMDFLFAGRKKSDFGPMTEFYSDVYKVKNEMMIILQSLAKDISTNESIFARKFLEFTTYVAQ